MDKASLAPPDPPLYLVHYLCCAKDKKTRVPTRTGKSGKMRRHFPLSEKSEGILNRLEKSEDFKLMLFVVFLVIFQ